MIKLESKRAYDSFHVLCLIFTHITLIMWVCLLHTFHSLYLFTYRWYRSYIDLVVFYNFKDLILWNYLSNFNKTYTCYKGQYVELIYQFSSNSKFLMIL